MQGKTIAMAAIVILLGLCFCAACGMGLVQSVSEVVAEAAASGTLKGSLLMTLHLCTTMVLTGAFFIVSGIRYLTNRGHVERLFLRKDDAWVASLRAPPIWLGVFGCLAAIVPQLVTMWPTSFEQFVEMIGAAEGLETWFSVLRLPVGTAPLSVAAAMVLYGVGATIAWHIMRSEVTIHAQTRQTTVVRRTILGRTKAAPHGRALSLELVERYSPVYKHVARDPDARWSAVLALRTEAGYVFLADETMGTTTLSFSPEQMREALVYWNRRLLADAS